MSKLPPPSMKKAAKKAPPPPRIPTAPAPLEQETAIDSTQLQLEFAAPKQELNIPTQKTMDYVIQTSKTESQPIQEASMNNATPENVVQENVEKEIALPPPPPKKSAIPNNPSKGPRKPNTTPPAPQKAKQQKVEEIATQPISSPAEESQDVVQSQQIHAIQKEPVKEEVVHHVKIVGVRTPPPPNKGGKPAARPKPPTNLKAKVEQTEAKEEEKQIFTQDKQVEQETVRQSIPFEQEVKALKHEVLKPITAAVELKPIPKTEIKVSIKTEQKSIPRPPQIQNRPQVLQQQKKRSVPNSGSKAVETVVADKKDNALTNKLEQLRRARELMKQQEQEQEQEEQQELQQQECEQQDSAQSYSDGQQEPDEDEQHEKEVVKQQNQPNKQEKIERNPQKQVVFNKQPAKEVQRSFSTEEIVPVQSVSAPQITPSEPALFEKPLAKPPPPSMRALPKNIPKPAQVFKPQPPKKISNPSNPDFRQEEAEQVKKNSSQAKDLPSPQLQSIQNQPIKPPVVQEKPAIIRGIQVSEPPRKDPISLRVKKPEGAEEIERLLEQYRRLKQSYIGNLQALGELSEQQSREERAAGERVERLLAGLNELDQRLRERCRVICE